MVGGWKQVGHEGRTEVTTVNLVRADIGVGGCTNGHHTASSDGPFGVVVWGLEAAKPSSRAQRWSAPRHSPARGG
ncbi:MAG: hypothetical protein IPO88_21085 [Nannocystis sp.]|nr:hypothetical protein [Nannocystis sp.]